MNVSSDDPEVPVEPGDADLVPPRRRRWYRPRNVGLAVLLVLVLMLGSGLVYYRSVTIEPDPLPGPATTQIFYSDGPLLATIGQVNSFRMRFDQINDPVKQAVVAAEDPTFWTNEGITFRGLLRSTWNSVSRGHDQPDPTITEQYVRLAYGGSTGLRREVQAKKLSDILSKQQILENYLNGMPFGRNSFGIEAAAQAYFGKTVDKSAPADRQLTVAEAMLLAGLLAQPNPDPTNPEGAPGFDPTINAVAAAQAQQRWESIHQQMIKLGYLTAADPVAYPGAEVRRFQPGPAAGLDQPAGAVVFQILAELSTSPGPFHGKTWDEIRNGGYKIYTTLDSRAQAAAESVADATVPGSQLYGQPANLQAALVAVQPGTGRVLAYYGGHDGASQADYAGIYQDQDGKWAGFGAHPAGSAFSVYTLAAALKAGYSLDSYWQWTAHDLPGRTGANQIRNTSACPSDLTARTGACSLFESTVASINTPLYAVTASVSPAKVLTMARDAGIDHLWSDTARIDFTPTTEMSTQTPRNFDTILGIGQYPITVADHANGLATFAANGVRSTEHYVLKVTDGDQVVYADRVPVTGQVPILAPANVGDLDYALGAVSSAKLSNGWPSAGKTGSWTPGQNSTSNFDAWMGGYTRKLAAAVWVGDRAGATPIRDKNGANIFGSGIPAQIWQQFMVKASTAMNLANDAGAAFPPKVGAGDQNPPGSVPRPSA